MCPSDEMSQLDVLLGISIPNLVEHGNRLNSFKLSKSRMFPENLLQLISLVGLVIPDIAEPGTPRQATFPQIADLRVELFTIDALP